MKALVDVAGTIQRPDGIGGVDVSRMLMHYASVDRRLSDASCCLAAPLRLLLSAEDPREATAFLVLAAGREAGASRSARVLFISGPVNSGQHFDVGRALREANLRRYLLEYGHGAAVLKGSSVGAVSFEPWGAPLKPRRRFTAAFVDNMFRDSSGASDATQVADAVAWLENLRSAMGMGPMVVVVPPRLHVPGGDFSNRLMAKGWEWMDLTSKAARASAQDWSSS